MVVRIWHGYTRPEHADAYAALLNPEVLPGIGTVKGYRGAHVLRRQAGDEVEFITVLFWDSLDDLRAAAGPGYERAIVPEERRRYLSRYDEQATHYDVASMQVPGAQVPAGPPGR